MDLRTALAAALGVGLGALLIAFPQALIRVHTVGRTSRDRGGEYGSDAGSGSGWVRTAVRFLGAALIGAGLYFGWSVLA